MKESLFNERDRAAGWTSKSMVLSYQSLAFLTSDTHFAVAERKRLLPSVSTAGMIRHLRCEWFVYNRLFRLSFPLWSRDSSPVKKPVSKIGSLHLRGRN